MRRTYCDLHAKVDNRPARRETRRLKAVPTLRPPVAGGLRDGYAAGLEALGREASPEGALVLHVAALLDQGPPPSARAALAAQLMRAWSAASAGGPIPSGVDELARKRRDR